MTGPVDPIDDVILAFLDHQEGGGPRPSLDHLGPADRVRADEILAGMVAARGMNPVGLRPSVESLLVGTPLAGILTGYDQGTVDLGTVRRVLAGIDRRATAVIDPTTDTVVYSYLDLRARFLLVDTNAPVVTENVRSTVERLLADDPDTARVGVVAARSGELATQMLAADEVGHTITTPRGAPYTRLESPLPLTLYVARMLEQSAPEWPAFDFDRAQGDPLDLHTMATEAARRVIERESGRSYKGDKRRAYKALVGQDRAIADLVVLVATRGSTVDLRAEADRLLRTAA